MTKPTDYANSMAKDIAESKEGVDGILKLVEYSLDDLEGIKDPRILVLGPGPHFPEAFLIREWAESRKHPVDVVCVDKEDINFLYTEKILKITDTQFFKMQSVHSDFGTYPFEPGNDLVLLLRFSNFELIQDAVFGRILRSLKDGGQFIMSGGVTDRFTGYSLQQRDIRLEKSLQVPFSFSDFYKTYAGRNFALKFRKISNGV